MFTLNRCSIETYINMADIQYFGIKFITKRFCLFNRSRQGAKWLQMAKTDKNEVPNLLEKIYYYCNKIIKNSQPHDTNLLKFLNHLESMPKVKKEPH